MRTPVTDGGAFTLLIPVFNEAPNLARTLEQVDTLREGVGKRMRVVLVDDGSTDGSGEVLDAWAEGRDGVRLLRFRRNRGLHSALLEGFRAADTTVVVTTEAHLQHDPWVLPALASRLDVTTDVVCGRRTRRNDPLWRRAGSKALNSLLRRLSGLRVHDVACLVKAWRRETGIEAFRDPAFAHWLRTLVRSRLAEVNIDFSRAREGRSSYGAVRLSRLAAEALLAAVRFKLENTRAGRAG